MPVAVAFLTALLSVWPLVPRPEVVAAFQPPSSPWGPGHRGVDLLGRPGEVVHAAAAGTVVFAAPLAGRGVVVVDHGSVRTTYEPVAATVHAGERVAEGAALGRLQTAMSHCFPRACLHWGLLRGTTYLDPLTLVGAGPVRLLPWSGTAGEARATAATTWSPGSWAFKPVGGPADRPGGGVRW
ncbi:MAG TPA: M23 family metallopeptidase [Marmoricola sp.]|nr:M23 family metallopeptidase [Marmoricola sp.]